MKKYLITLTLTTVLFLVSCISNKKETNNEAVSKTEKTEKKPDMHTSQNALDWAGTYVGTLPCADCEGIKTTIRINEDMTYDAVTEYLGKKDAVFETRGYYKWKEDGQHILLSDDNETTYKVGENKLIQLDKSHKLVQGELADMYVLKKQNNTIAKAVTFTNTKWQLTKIMGQEVTDSSAFISFLEEDNKVFGNNGCNTFSGSYTIENNSQLSFSKIATTMKACPDMTVEDKFTEVLNKADNFSLSGNTMTLNKAKMAPLAVFQAVNK